MVLLLSFTIRGILRGTVAQVFAFFGVAFGVWAAAWVASWIGDHWREARPVFVYLVLRWIVAVLAGLALATMIDWLGERAAKAVRGGPLSWLDRLVGALLGLAIGAIVASLVALVAVQAPALRAARTAAMRGVLARPLIAQGARFTGVRVMPVPGAHWLHAQFTMAERRLSMPRSS